MPFHVSSLKIVSFLNRAEYISYTYILNLKFDNSIKTVCEVEKTYEGQCQCDKDKGKGVSDVMTRYLVRVFPARGAH